MARSAIALEGPAYLSLLHADPADNMVPALRHHFDGTGFGTVTKRDDARKVLNEDLADAVVRCRLWVAAPADRTCSAPLLLSRHPWSSPADRCRR